MTTNDSKTFKNILKYVFKSFWVVLDDFERFEIFDFLGGSDHFD